MMKSELLRVNIKQFEEDFSKYMVDGELDVDSIINDYSSQHGDPGAAEAPEGEPDLPEGDEPETPEGDPQPEDNPTPEGDPEPQGEPEPEEQPKRTPDQAFAELRRKAESYEPLAKWVENLAKQQGFQDPQELINAFQQRQLEREAQEKGVPVDVYQRLQQLEQENQQSKEEIKSQQFNSEVEQVKSKYNLDDAALTEVFRFMGQKGYDAGDIPFEDAYVLANRETLIQQAEERGRQAYLEETRKRQQSATTQPGTGAADSSSKPGSDIDYSSEAILGKFKELGIPID